MRLEFRDLLSVVFKGILYPRRWFLLDSRGSVIDRGLARSFVLDATTMPQFFNARTKPLKLGP